MLVFVIVMPNFNACVYMCDAECGALLLHCCQRAGHAMRAGNCRQAKGPDAGVKHALSTHLLGQQLSYKDFRSACDQLIAFCSAFSASACINSAPTHLLIHAIVRARAAPRRQKEVPKSHGWDPAPAVQQRQQGMERIRNKWTRTLKV